MLALFRSAVAILLNVKCLGKAVEVSIEKKYFKLANNLSYLTYKHLLDWLELGKDSIKLKLWEYSNLNQTFLKCLSGSLLGVQVCPL